MSALDRMIAAWQAFRDPALVGEAKGMREAIIELERYQEFAILRTQWLGDYLSPRIDRLSYSDQDAIHRRLYGP